MNTQRTKEMNSKKSKKRLCTILHHRHRIVRLDTEHVFEIWVQDNSMLETILPLRTWESFNACVVRLLFSNSYTLEIYLYAIWMFTFCTTLLSFGLTLGYKRGERRDSRAFYHTV